MTNADGLKTQLHYQALLQSARQNGEVGVFKHMHIPTTPTCRLGFTGRKVSKKGLKEVAQKLLDAALQPGANPALIKAAINMARYR